jgi:hypothetical protein
MPPVMVRVFLGDFLKFCKLFSLIPFKILGA